VREVALCTRWHGLLSDFLPLPFWEEFFVAKKSKRNVQKVLTQLKFIKTITKALLYKYSLATYYYPECRF